MKCVQKKPVSRLKQHEDQFGEMPEMPPLSCEYSEALKQRFFEILPSIQGEQGFKTLSFSEIESWCNMTHSYITPAESILMRRLCEAYASQYLLSSDPACPAPWSRVILDGESRESIESGTKRLFAQLRAHKHKQQRGR